VSPHEYKLWVSKLSSLTSAQRDDLLTRVKLLSKTSSKEHVGKQEFGDRVLNTICNVMRKNNVETPNPATLRKSAAYVSSKNKLEDLQTFFESISKSKLVQDAILRESAQLLYHDLLQWQNIAISSHTLLKQIHRIHATLNRHFPGYLQSGLLTKIIKGS
jgi:hypothetical protein